MKGLKIIFFISFCFAVVKASQYLRALYINDLTGTVLTLVNSMPNLLASMSLPFILKLVTNYIGKASRRGFFIHCIQALGILIIHELLRYKILNIDVDVYDILASLVGVVLAYLLYYLFKERNTPS